MSTFNEYLRTLLQDKHLSVAALSRLSGIERTAIQKALSGQRVLPYDTLSQLSYCLRLTPQEHQRLYHYYSALFDSESIRRSRQIIDQLFSELSNLNFTAPPVEETHLLLSLDEYAGDKTIFVGNTNIQPLLRLILAEELIRDDARIELTVPPSADFLNNSILEQYLHGPTTANITQIIAFDSSGMPEDINLHNLDCFRQILPACLFSNKHYQPYYYYENNVAAQYTEPFPYFLLTHNCVICLSSDCTRAMLLRTAEQVAYFHQHFQVLLKQCYNLVQYTTDPVEMLNAYQRCTDNDGFYMVMDQPCFGRFYPNEKITEFIHPELPFYKELVSASQQRFTNLSQVEHFYTLFSEQGVRRYLQTGMLDDFPTAFVKIFTPEWRVHVIRQLAAAIRSGNVVGCMLQKDVFPDYLSLCTSQVSGIGFFTTAQFPLSEGICSIQIQEPNLCRAFHDWLTHLPNSEQTLTTTETADILDNLVTQSMQFCKENHHVTEAK